ncbi:MAG: GxxExxY protein [Verrucomicrobiota bacterium JB025]|nr:GxxExxY protein [Verrucomicrobiota bacterium JB025]
MDYTPTSHPHSKLTERIIGAAMAVHREIGPGLDEKIYENSLCLEFAAQALDFTQQEQFPVYYRGRIVGKLITDLIVEKAVVVETKVADQISDTHIAQTLSYLSITKLQVGLILNFKTASLGVKRVANIYQ